MEANPAIIPASYIRYDIGQETSVETLVDWVQFSCEREANVQCFSNNHKHRTEPCSN